ncbi:hypothetical protein DdX_05061 [Ditylenchus destructor]|uniref:Uncharacterized protein n=1 Tax=Ditylenchus destructor TaxID=166010 RepID=A0AAD4NDP0_9BILA|nr:hypothetical protein DdX_05061 [Ditylenchus destructor]
MAWGDGGVYGWARTIKFSENVELIDAAKEYTSAVPTPGTAVPTPGSAVPTPGSAVPSAESAVPAPACAVQSPGAVNTQNAVLNKFTKEDVQHVQISEGLFDLPEGDIIQIKRRWDELKKN